MKKIALLLITNLTLLLSNSDLQTDLDHDGKKDKVYFEHKDKNVYLTCQLSSQNFKKVRSHNIKDYFEVMEDSLLTKTSSGFKYHINFRKSGIKYQFRYEKKTKKMQLIGIEYFGEEGTSSANLVTNQYVANLVYYSELEGKLIKLPSIKEKGNYEKIYLQEFSHFSIQNELVYEKLKAEDMKRRNYKFFKNFIAKKFPNYELLEYKDIKTNKSKVVVLESKKKGEPYSELDDGFGRKAVLVKNDVDGFKVLAQNNQIIGCSTCGGAGVGDPYRGITVKGKYLSFEELYGACVKDFQVTTFKYNEKKKKWYLHKLGIESTYCNEEENGKPKVETKIKTVKNFGVVEFSEFEDGLRWED